MKIIQPRYREYIEDITLDYDLLDTPGAGYTFPCDKHGNVILNYMHEAAVTNYFNCKLGVYNVARPYIRDNSHHYMSEEIRECDNCKREAYFSRHCGVFVCHDCNMHDGLARCYCGWSLSGNNGRQELIEMGENLDDDY